MDKKETIKNETKKIFNIIKDEFYEESYSLPKETLIDTSSGHYSLDDTGNPDDVENGDLCGSVIPGYVIKLRQKDDTGRVYISDFTCASFHWDWLERYNKDAANSCYGILRHDEFEQIYYVIVVDKFDLYEAWKSNGEFDVESHFDADGNWVSVTDEYTFEDFKEDYIKYRQWLEL